MVNTSENGNYVTILAIYDDDDENQAFRPSRKSSIQSGSVKYSLNTNTACNKPTSDESCYVEVNSLADPPSEGIRIKLDDNEDNAVNVSSLPTNARRDSHSSKFDKSLRTLSSSILSTQVPLTSVLKRSWGSPKTSVISSPENERRVRKVVNVDTESGYAEIKETSPLSMSARTAARKSRITDGFFEAKERLEESLELQTECEKRISLIPPIQGAVNGQTIIVLSDSLVNRNIGIDVVPLYDSFSNSKMKSIEVRRIDKDGRIAADGRIKVGDNITEINGRPVYQMSISRARAYLDEIQSLLNPSITIDRPLKTFVTTGSADTYHKAQTSTSSTITQKRPIFSALQQANTSEIGVISSFELVKTENGFGFTITSRENARKQRLFYIGTVKPDSSAFGLLKSGDRLLEINDESTINSTQMNLVDKLKRLKVGETVRLLISRLNPSDEVEQKSPHRSLSPVINDRELHRTLDESSETSFISRIEPNKNDEILYLDIALNDTGSAGLGVSLKARAVLRPDGFREDCGIFVKKVLVGGAAYKDGRLRVNDELIGIEDIDLRSFAKNSDSSEAITKCLKELGPSATKVRLIVQRNESEISRSNSLHDANQFNKNSPNVHLDDYAVIVKERRLNDRISDGLRKTICSELSYNAYEDIESLSNRRQQSISDDEGSQINVDAFDRENPTRRSISEKRHIGKTNEAYPALLQKIKNSRQTSASSLRASYVEQPNCISQKHLREHNLSIQERKRLRNSYKRSASSAALSNREKLFEKDEIIISPNEINLNFNANIDERNASPQRRSKSSDCVLSGINRNIQNFSELEISNDSVSKKTLCNVHKIQKQKSPPGCPNHRGREGIPEIESECKEYGNRASYSNPLQQSAVPKEKQHHKSSGGLLSRLSQKFGSWSRDSSPEKQPDISNEHLRKQEEGRKKMSGNCDRSKQKSPFIGVEQTHHGHRIQFPQQVLHLYTSEDGDAGSSKESVFLDDLPVEGFIRVANSKFYNSVIVRGKSATPQSKHFMRGKDSNFRISAEDLDIRQVQKKISAAGHNNHLRTPTSSVALSTANARSPVRNSDTAGHSLKEKNISKIHPNRDTTAVAALTITKPLIHGSHTAARVEAVLPVFHRTFGPATRIYSSTLRTDFHKVGSSTMNDFDPAPHKHQQRRTEDTSRIISIPVVTKSYPHPPLVFPTSRTFFLPESKKNSFEGNKGQVSRKKILQKTTPTTQLESSKFTDSHQTYNVIQNRSPTNNLESTGSLVENNSNYHPICKIKVHRFPEFKSVLVHSPEKLYNTRNFNFASLDLDSSRLDYAKLLRPIRKNRVHQSGETATTTPTAECLRDHGHDKISTV